MGLNDKPQSWRQRVEGVLGIRLTDDQAKRLFWWVTEEHRQAVAEAQEEPCVN